MKILSPKKWKELLVYGITMLMNLPEMNNLLWALIHDMDGEENLDIYRLVTMSEEEIEGLEYMQSQPNSSAISRHKFVTLWACLYWARDMTGTPIEDFLALTPEEFVKYLPESQHQKVNNPNNRPTPLAPPGQCPPLDLLAKFKRGVKWDLTVFEMIKDIKQWDSWKRTFMVTANAQPRRSKEGDQPKVHSSAIRGCTIL